MAETTLTGHIAGVEITINDRWIRQRCAWCGYVLADYDLTRVAVPIGQPGRPGGWETGAIVMVDGNASWVVEIAGYDLPAETCARRETDPPPRTGPSAADADPPAEPARPASDVLACDLAAIETRYHDYMARWDAGPVRIDRWHITAQRSADDVGELLARLAESERKLDQLRADVETYRQHSTTLNSVGYLVADALAACKGDERYVGDPVAQVERLIDERNVAQINLVKLRGAYAQIVSAFTEKGHPGRPCLRTGWIGESAVVKWHQIYRETQP